MTDKTPEELLEMAEKLQGKAIRSQAAAKEGHGPAAARTLDELAHVSEAVSGVRQGYTNVRNPVVKFYDDFLHPVGSVVKGISKGLFGTAKWLLKKTDSDNYKSRFGKTCAKVGRVFVLGAVVCSGLQMWPGAFGGDTVRYFTTDVMKDAAMMTLTSKTETVYLNDAKVLQEGGYLVKGCRHLETCDRNSAVSFRVDRSLANTFWSYANKRAGYNPDQIVAPVAPGVNECQVTTYGLRFPGARALSIFPTVLDISCSPVTSSSAKVSFNFASNNNTSSVAMAAATVAVRRVDVPLASPV